MFLLDLRRPAIILKFVIMLLIFFLNEIINYFAVLLSFMIFIYLIRPEHLNDLINREVLMLIL